MAQHSSIGINSDQISLISSPKAFAQSILSAIRGATKRIYITALYIQDDEAGREILHALCQAKQANPALDINVFVDYRRAQRGLIGEKEQLGNRALYLNLSEEYAETINIYGVALKSKEFLGVLHLKGMVFDDNVLYSGASLNNVYLHHDDKYRLDRYYDIHSPALANSFVKFLDEYLIEPGRCPLLNRGDLPNIQRQKQLTTQLRNQLKKVSYICDESSSGDISIQPLLGFGRRKNLLNKSIRQVVRNAEKELLIFTPYFNFPKVLSRDVVRALKKGVKVDIVVGDKTANDFYESDQSKFSFINIVPYIYESLLHRFIKKQQKFIDSGLLNIHLWKHGNNSYHLKGVIADNRCHMLTGSNLNPRAWNLDIENGLLIDDPKKSLLPLLEQEKSIIFAHTKRIKSANCIEQPNQYPEKPKKLMKRLKVSSIDKILQRFL